MLQHQVGKAGWSVGRDVAHQLSAFYLHLQSALPPPFLACSTTCWRWRGGQTASCWLLARWTGRSISGTRTRRYCRYGAVLQYCRWFTSLPAASGLLPTAACTPCHFAAPQGTISGRRDIAGGRLRSDRRTADNNSSGRCFTSLAFSADGSFLLAGGSSKYVCLYDVAERVMLRRFQVSHNKSLDGVLDQLNSK